METDSDTTIERLVDQAEEQGSLAPADIVALIPEAASDAELMEALVGRLRAEGVDVSEEEEEEELVDANLEQVSSLEG